MATLERESFRRRAPSVGRVERLRVLFCTLNYYPAPTGGAERQARLQAEELAKRGHHVTVVCPRHAGTRSGEINGVDVVRLPWIDRRWCRRITSLLVLGLYVLSRVRRFQIVHVHLANLQADVVVGLANIFGLPTYVKVACGGRTGEVARLGKIAWATRWYGLRHATVVQALSREIESELHSIHVPTERIVSISNGLDLSCFRPSDADERSRLREALELPQDALLYLFAGRFAHYKGILDLVEVWRARQWPGGRLVLVGTAATDQPVGEIPLRDDMILRGWTNDVVDYLRAVDVFVCPSHADGMSNSLLEALACGLPVVATRAGAAEALIDDGVSGFLVDIEDREALGDRLSRLHADPVLRASLGAAAVRGVQRCSISRVVEQIESRYLEVVSR